MLSDGIESCKKGADEMGERLSFASGYMEGTHAGRGAADCGAIKKKSACIGAGGLL